jgi:membrane-associated phospholipid phosphatase
MNIDLTSYNLPRLQNMMVFIVTMIILAVISYYFLDIPIAHYGYYHTRISNKHFLWLYATYLQPLYFIISPWFVFYLIARVMLQKPILTWHKIVILMIFSMSITFFINEQLRFVFGRYWPATWLNGNLSLIEHNAYGFTWFKMQKELQAFPSGHTALIFGFMAPLLWLGHSKKIKIFALLNGLAVGLGLILMCYHFFSDVLIGALVGIAVAYFILYSLKKYNNVKRVV